MPVVQLCMCKVDQVNISFVVKSWRHGIAIFGPAAQEAVDILQVLNLCIQIYVKYFMC